MSLNTEKQKRGERGKTLRIGKRQIEHWQMISLLLMVYDFVAVCAAYLLALLLRFDGVYSQIDPRFLQPYNKLLPGQD